MIFEFVTPNAITTRNAAGYTAEFFRVLGEGEKIDADELKMGWVESEQNGKVIILFGHTATHGIPRTKK